KIPVLLDVSFEVARREFVAIMGPSGSGKTSLLQILSGLDLPSAGGVEVDGTSMEKLDERGRTLLRRDRIGFVFQFFNLLPTLTVEENISLPLMLAGARDAIAFAKARELAELVGLVPRLSHYPAQLSGGEMQRAAIARAIIHRPALLLADEPTGNLDSVNGAIVLKLLRELNEEMKLTVLLATHSRETAQMSERIIHMKDGRIQEIEET